MTVLQILSSLVCLWLAATLRGRSSPGDGRPSPWGLAKYSLRHGIMVVTVPILGYFGVVRFMQGLGIPSVFWFALATGLTALVMVGAEVELTGNILIDCLLLSFALVGAVFTVINGVPTALTLLDSANLCRWALLCVGAAILVRVALWIIRGN
jgi:hypothetical protein